MRDFFVLGILLFFMVVLIRLVFILNEFVCRSFYDISVEGSSVVFKGTPEDYYANPHVEFNVSVDENSNYLVSYKFKGPQKRDWSFKWSHQERATDEQILKFGIPKSMFEPYYPVDSVLKKRERQMKEGMFIQRGRYLKPNLVNMTKYYRNYLEPVIKLLENTWPEGSTRREKIDFVMKFCQDIPYGVPPKYFNNKYIGGVFPPPQVFVNKFGDCDSKAVIFCSVMSYIENMDVILLFETGHVLPAIKGIPKPYDSHYSYKNETYIMADTAGPGRNPFGMITNPYQKIVNVEEVVF